MKKMRDLRVALLGTVSVAFLLSAFPASTADKKVVMVFRKPGENFEHVYDKLKKELRRYDVRDVVIEQDTPYSDFADEVRKAKPVLGVFMDNRPVNLAIKWNEEEAAKLKGVALMGLNLQSVLKGNKLIAGVAFEAPAYTLVAQFRNHVQKQVKKAVVFYRKSVFADIVKQGQDQLKTEGITLKAIDVEQEGKDKAAVEKFLKKQLPALVQKPGEADVIWVLLDSVLLSPELFSGVWIPAARSNKVPFVTGIERFVDPSMDFAAFGVSPNLEDLAGQASQMIERIVEEGENPEKVGVEQLVSVNKVLNQKRIDALGLKVREDKKADLKVLE